MQNNKLNYRNNKSNYKIDGFGAVIIGVISFLYVLLITKLAEIISVQYQDENDEKNQISVYVMIIYFISIIGIIAGYIWFNDNNDNNDNNNIQTPNWIVRWSLSVGGVLMLIYTIINYWDYLNEYSKLILIFLSISCVIYYLYKYY